MRTLLFDIDGTLLLTNQGGSGALKRAITQEFGIDKVRMDMRFAGRTDRSLLVEILQRNGLPADAGNQARLEALYTELLPEVLVRNGGRVMPGIIDLLQQLATVEDLRCYVMTGNLHKTAICKLNHFGLLPYFRGIFGGDHDHERDQLAIRTAAALRDRYGNAATDDVVIIGDTPADIRCGRAIGAKVVAVCTGQYDRTRLLSEKPLTVFDDLSDVPSVLELLTNHSSSRARPGSPDWP